MYESNLNLENNNIYKCKICKKFNCSLCFLFDEHIKQDINNIKIYTKKCHIHHSALNNYCIECGNNICIFCLKKIIKIIFINLIK